MLLVKTFLPQIPNRQCRFTHTKQILRHCPIPNDRYKKKKDGRNHIEKLTKKLGAEKSRSNKKTLDSDPSERELVASEESNSTATSEQSEIQTPIRVQLRKRERQRQRISQFFFFFAIFFPSLSLSLSLSLLSLSSPSVSLSSSLSLSLLWF